MALQVHKDQQVQREQQDLQGKLEQQVLKDQSVKLVQLAKLVLPVHRVQSG
jgi:hypothetical protein